VINHGIPEKLWEDWFGGFMSGLGFRSFGAIASSIEEAKSEIFIIDWWLCPELYLRRPFDAHGSSRLDALTEAKAKQGV
ncbi:hypothetical protein IFM89_029492, partial [Coptis chinensis]